MSSKELALLKEQLELFLLSHPQTIISDPRAGWIRLEDSRFCFEVQFGKLIFTLWNSEQSVTRRICGIEQCDRDRLVLRTAYGGIPSIEMVFDANLSSGAIAEKRAARRKFPSKLLRMLRLFCPEIRVDRVTSGRDLSRSFSEHYCRGIGVEGNRQWALFGVNACEDQVTIDACLSFALIWLEELRRAQGRQVVAGLKLLIPVGRSETLTTRAAFLQQSGLRVDVLAYEDRNGLGCFLDLADYGNLDTRLSRVDRVPLPLEQIPCHLLPPAVRSRLELIEIIHRPASAMFSIRYRGLEFARLSDERHPKLTFGVGAMETLYDRSLENELSRLIDNLESIRRPGSLLPLHPFYRLQSERWLESLVLSDIRRIQFDLDPNFVYPQVPAFSGLDRGVIDILTLTRDRRLAVVELKVTEDINLPLQALDYWTRVKWHHGRGDFERQGYFSGVKVGPQSPVVLLVCPSFRFHSTTEGILKYFPREIEVIKVGINENWREGIQVLYRRRA